MVDYAELRKKRQQQARTKTTVDYAALREKRAQPPPPQTVETVLRLPEPERPLSLPTAMLREVMQRQQPSQIAQEVARSESQRVQERMDQPPLGERIASGVQAVRQAIGDIPYTFTSSASFGLSDLLGRALGVESLEEQKARRERIGGRIGEIAGYIMPGAAIERGIATAARPLIQNLPRAGQLAATGSAAGLTEAALQEAGDVAFRGETFDPLNVAIGAAAGGAIGGATPVIERGIRRLVDILRQRRATEQPILALPQPRERGRRVQVETPKEKAVEVQTQPVREADTGAQAAKQVDDVPKGVFPEPIPAEPVRQGWFERLFGRQAVGIISRLRPAGRNLLTTEGQIVDKPIRRTAEGLWESAKARGRQFWQNYVDMNAPIKKFGDEAYKAAMDSSRATQIANVIINDKFVTPEGQVVGEGLRNIIRKVGRGNYNQFTDYLILRHALTRMRRGERVYDEFLKMTPEKVQERINFLESRFPEFRGIAQEWDSYFKNLREAYGVEGELITPELARYLEERNPNYAPMRRQFTDAEKTGLGGWKAGGLFSGQKAPIKEVSPTGSTRKIVDPVRSAIEQTEAWVQAAMRNRVMKEVVNRITADPQGMKSIAEIVQPKKGQPDLVDILRKEGPEDFLEELQKDFNKLFRRQRLDQDNIVRAMIGGRPVYVKVKDPEALRALIGMGPENANIAMQFLSDLVKQGATGVLAPLFAVKSATMDISQALIQAEKPVQHLAYLVASFFSALADTLHIPGLRNMARDFYRAGGGYNAVLKSENRLKGNIRSMRLDPLLSPWTIAKGIGRTVAAPFKVSNNIAKIAENMNRIAAYHYKLRQLGEPTPANVREAMNYAREITINYSRRGAKSQRWEAIFVYQNAAIQGLYRFVKNFKERPGKTAIMLSATVLVPKLMEYLSFGDDPDYQRIPARERYRNLYIWKNEDGTFIKIPLSPEFNAIGAFMVDMLRAFKDGDPEAFKGTTDALMNAFTPPSISGAAQGLTQGGGVEQSWWGMVNQTSIGPIAGAMANQAWYGGPIESMRFTDRSPSQRYDERTSAVAKWLGEQLGWSPIKIDYVLRSYGGDPARLLLPLTSEIGSGRQKQTLLRNFITDPVFTNTITEDFYRGKEMLSQAYRDYVETGKEPPEWYDDNLRKFVTSTAKGSVSKRLSDLYDRKRAIETNKELSNEERSEQLRETQRQINELLIEVNARMREAGVPLLNR